MLPDPILGRLLLDHFLRSSQEFGKVFSGVNNLVIFKLYQDERRVPRRDKWILQWWWRNISNPVSFNKNWITEIGIHDFSGLANIQL